MHNFSDEQVEAAALAMHRDPGPRGGYGWTEYLSQARAALVAAQGAAPQRIGRLNLARHYWRSQGYDYDLHGQDGNNDYEMGMAVADAALAAIAAAQGAAPQTESGCWHESNCSCAAALGLTAGQERENDEQRTQH